LAKIGICIKIRQIHLFFVWSLYRNRRGQEFIASRDEFRGGGKIKNHRRKAIPLRFTISYQLTTVVINLKFLVDAIPSRGVEPLQENSQTFINTKLTENTNSRLCASLCKPLQKDPENAAISPAEKQTAIKSELQEITTALQHLPNELLPDMTGLLQLWPRLSDRTRSEIKRMITAELPATEAEKTLPPKIIYDFGYQYRTFDDVVNLIKYFKITVLCDIRTSPYSRNPDFNQEMLKKLPCKYIWRGKTLGGLRGEKLDEWTNGLVEVAKLAATEKVALMCMEYDVGACHRKLLIEILQQRYRLFGVHL
jgi:hypothetical protein